MTISDPIQMRIQAFGDAAFSLLHEQYKNKATIKIGEKEFIATNVERKFNDQETTNCGSNIQEFFRVKMPWTGEGLPPVGSHIEYLTVDKGEYWCSGDVSYIGPKFIVVTYQHPTEGESEACMNHSISEPPLSTRIRPIRTPEQIAAEARNKAAAEMSEATQGAKDWNEAFKMLHDKGYRLFEIVKESGCPHSSSYNDGAALCCSFCGKG